MGRAGESTRGLLTVGRAGNDLAAFSRLGMLPFHAKRSMIVISSGAADVVGITFGLCQCRRRRAHPSSGQAERRKTLLRGSGFLGSRGQ